MGTYVHGDKTAGDDDALIIVEFENGCRGLAEESWAKPGGMDDRAEVYGSDGVAYLKIESFQRDTSRDLDTTLWQLYREGMKSLVIDVRGNPGGLLSAAVDVADKFVYQGRIVSTRGRNHEEDYDYAHLD